MISKKNIFCVLLGISLMGNLRAQEVSEMALTFLNSLPPELRAQTNFSLNDEERYTMYYVPIARKGPTFHDFNETQKSAALQLLRASLSEEGYRKTNEIRELENVLIRIENDNYLMPDGKLRRDPLNYHFSIFGSPSPTEIWGWRFEGHHISLNFTSNEGTLWSGTPFFFGSNPGIVKAEGAPDRQVLKQETELGFELINALSKEQLSKAKFSEVAPGDIITQNKRKIEGIETKGIAFNELTPNQQQLFMQLLEAYIGNYIFEFSETFREKIRNAGFDNLHFAWAGGLQPGMANYYRIHGPMLLIEYDNTQNNANHIHTVIRDLTNDYAADLLEQHYKKEH